MRHLFAAQVAVSDQVHTLWDYLNLTQPINLTLLLPHRQSLTASPFPSMTMIRRFCTTCVIGPRRGYIPLPNRSCYQIH